MMNIRLDFHFKDIEYSEGGCTSDYTLEGGRKDSSRIYDPVTVHE